MAALVAYLTDIYHIYVAAFLTIVIKVIIIPRILKQVIRRLDVKRELAMYVNIPASLIICGALVILAFFITKPINIIANAIARESRVRRNPR